eukprot:4853258-Amphidinium_carterae.1
MTAREHTLRVETVCVRACLRSGMCVRYLLTPAHTPDNQHKNGPVQTDKLIRDANISEQI